MIKKYIDKSIMIQDLQKGSINAIIPFTVPKGSGDEEVLISILLGKKNK